MSRRTRRTGKIERLGGAGSQRRTVEIVLATAGGMERLYQQAQQYVDWVFESDAPLTADPHAFTHHVASSDGDTSSDFSLDACRAHPVLRTVMSERFVGVVQAVQGPAPRKSAAVFVVLNFLLQACPRVQAPDAPIRTALYALNMEDFAILMALFETLVPHYKDQQTFFVTFLLVFTCYLNRFVSPSIARLGAASVAVPAVQFLKTWLFHCPEFIAVRRLHQSGSVSYAMWDELQVIVSDARRRLAASQRNSLATDSSPLSAADWDGVCEDLLTFLSTLSCDLQTVYVGNEIFESIDLYRSSLFLSAEQALANQIAHVLDLVRSHSHSHASSDLPDPDRLFQLSIEHHFSLQMVLAVYPYHAMRVTRTRIAGKCIHFTAEAVERSARSIPSMDAADALAGRFLNLMEKMVEFSQFRHEISDMVQLLSLSLQYACLIDVTSHRTMFMSLLPLDEATVDGEKCRQDWPCFKRTVHIFASGVGRELLLRNAKRLVDGVFVNDSDNGPDNMFGLVVSQLVKKGLRECCRALVQDPRFSVDVPLNIRRLFLPPATTIAIDIVSSSSKEVPQMTHDGSLTLEENLLRAFSSHELEEVKAMYDKFTPGEGRKVQSQLRVLARNMSSEHRVGAIRLLNALVEWGVGGAEVLKTRFVDFAVTGVIQAAERRGVAHYLRARFHDSIPNMKSLTESIFRAALECTDIQCLREICNACKAEDISRFLHFDSLVLAARKVLTTFGGSDGHQIIPGSGRSVHQVTFALFRILGCIPGSMTILFPRLFDRSVCETVPCHPEALSSLIMQGVYYVQKKYHRQLFKTLHCLQARLLWVSSREPSIIKTRWWRKLWETCGQPTPLKATAHTATTATFSSKAWEDMWDSVFSVGYAGSPSSLNHVVSVKSSKLWNAGLLVTRDFPVDEAFVAVPSVSTFACWEQQHAISLASQRHNGDVGSASAMQETVDYAHREQLWLRFFLTKVEPGCYVSRHGEDHDITRAKSLFMATVIACAKGFADAPGHLDSVSGCTPATSLICIVQSLAVAIHDKPNSTNTWLLETLVEFVSVPSKSDVSAWKQSFYKLPHSTRALHSTLRAIGVPYLVNSFENCEPGKSETKEMVQLVHRIFTSQTDALFREDENLLLLILEALFYLHTFERRHAQTTFTVRALFRQALCNDEALLKAVNSLWPRLLEGEFGVGRQRTADVELFFKDLLVLPSGATHGDLQDRSSGFVTSRKRSHESAFTSFDQYEKDPTTFAAVA
jgi:hypothetical protein